jgi:hypothetical protein
VKKHVEMAKTGGMILVTVPNFSGASLTRLAYRLVGKEQYLRTTHNLGIMRRKRFEEVFVQDRLECLFCDFHGSVTLPSPPIRGVVEVFEKINSFVGSVVVNSSEFSPDLVFLGCKAK